MIRVLAREAGETFRDCPGADLSALIKKPDVITWVDLEQPTAKDLEVLVEPFRFHPLTIEDATNDIYDPPKIDDYREYVFIIAQAMDFDPVSKALVTTELNIYLGQNFIVTVHKRPLQLVHDVMNSCREGMHRTCQGAEWVVHALLDMLVDRLMPVVEAMDEEIEALEDRALEEKGDRALLERMSEMKRQTLRLRWLVAPQRDLMSRISRGDFHDLVHDDSLMYFRDIYDHLMRLDSMIEGLRDLGESVIAIHLSSQNNRMNEIMKTLSIVGSIFLPLTLVASVFGTNFDDTYMPTGWPGFGIMCGSFLVTSGAMVTMFKRRGWI